MNPIGNFRGHDRWGRFRRAGKLVLGPFIIICLLGSGPMRDGTDVTAGGGYRQDVRDAHYGAACSSPSAHWKYTERIADLAIDVRQKKPDSGFVFAAEGEGAIKYVPSGTCSGDCEAFRSDVGRAGFGMHLALRFGYQWKYGGLMGGPGFFASSMTREPFPDATQNSFMPFPSTEFWVGNRTFNVFVDGFSNMAFHDLTLAKAGVQHATDDYKISGGGGIGYAGWLGFADVDAKLGDTWWLGISGDVDQKWNIAAMLRFTFEFDRPSSQPANPAY